MEGLNQKIKTMTRLVERGYIQSQQGRRVQIIYQPAAQNEFTIGGIESFREAAARNNFTATTKVIRFASEFVNESLAVQTGFPVGSEIYEVRRVRYLDGKTLILDINVFRRDIVPDLTAEIAAESIYDYLENELGMTIVTSKRCITVEQANVDDLSWLELDGYNCLAVVSGRTYNSDGIQFEYTQSRHHPDYFCFEDTVVRKR